MQSTQVGLLSYSFSIWLIVRSLMEKGWPRKM